MKTLSTAVIIVAALLVSGVAQAKHDGHDGKRHDRHERQLNEGKRFDRHGNKADDAKRHDYRYPSYDDRRWHKPHKRHGHRDVVRLDLPVYVRGSERIHLRRLVSRRYGIDLSQYRLRKVVVNNHGRHYASARLRVGHHVSDAQHLHRGKNHLRAPRNSDGRWVLGVHNARIDNIRVVLEPRYGWAYRDHYRPDARPWFKAARQPW